MTQTDLIAAIERTQASGGSVVVLSLAEAVTLRDQLISATDGLTSNPPVAGEISSNGERYDPDDNGAKSYALAIRVIRLNMIAEGKIAPRQDDPDEMALAPIARRRNDRSVEHHVSA